MSKQSKEDFISNVEEHARDGALWGVYTFKDNCGNDITSLDLSPEEDAINTDACRVSLDKELNVLYQDCVEKDKVLVAAVRKLNAACAAKLEDING